jgi:plastocyanin
VAITGLPHFDGFDDRRGDGTVTGEQGRTGEGETYSLFYPPAVWIEVGQTVDFTVDNSESGDYNVQHNGSSTDRFVSNSHDEEGEFSHTFGSAGVYMYECSANRNIGGIGVIVVGRPE